MYQALYRKWRPRVFADVVGQPQVVTTLLGELRANRVAHAYLFTGSRGTGKTTCAKILAKAVNCLNPKNGDPCGECEACKGIDNGSFTDVVEIDAASNNGVDSIRTLREETVYTPARAKYRVYIIDEVHMLSAGAWGALLKTLEEPPAYVLFILATTEVHKVPATILSRCQRFDFRRIPPADIAARLLEVSKEEKIPLTKDGADTIARLSDGALRDALSLLDTCRSNEIETLDETAIKQAIGLAGEEYLYALSAAVQKKDGKAALDILDDLYASSKDADRLCEELIGHFRIIMRKQAGCSVAVSPSEEKQLAALSQVLPPSTVLYALDTLAKTAEALRYTPDKRVEMEMCLLKLCNPAWDISVSSLADRLSTLEEQLKKGAQIPVSSSAGLPITAVPEPRKVTVEKESSLTSSMPKEEIIKKVETKAIVTPPMISEEATLTQPLSCWPEVLEALGKLDPPLRGVLEHSKAVLRGEHVLVDAQNAMFGELIRQPLHQKPLVEAVRTATGKPYKVGIFKSSFQTKAEKKVEDPFDSLLNAAMKGGIPVEEKK
ncbi:MAG TPA: DNA polymerase III subunit gamma/tau [Ruminococcaceae bacterium]|nr:DNA polymerase III subunit gamma/tau [Oscillospiraceae bacterium]